MNFIQSAQAQTQLLSTPNAVLFCWQGRDIKPGSKLNFCPEERKGNNPTVFVCLQSSSCALMLQPHSVVVSHESC